MTLLKLEQGQTSKLVSIDSSLAGYDRLMELGFTVGEDITVVRKAPLGGPIQVIISDTSYAIRRSEAACIKVTPIF